MPFALQINIRGDRRPEPEANGVSYLKMPLNYSRGKGCAASGSGRTERMEHFTPVSAALGGSFIGLSAALLWIANGRIAGISGILGRLASPPRSDLGWRLAFLAGLVVVPLLSALVVAPPTIVMEASPVALVGAGLLVGFGTRLGGGCTSGHGVCGIARLSRRSITATALFMTSAAVTVFIVRHLVGV
jgi:hypothetical protein